MNGNDEKLSINKFERVENNKQLSSGMPNYFLPEMKEHMHPSKVSRTIASKNNSMKEMNSRDLYFYNLYAQYRFFKTTLKIEKDELKVCPQFHHSMMGQKPLLSRPVIPVKLAMSNMDELKGNPDMIVLFPEMALPVDHDDQKTIVYDQIMDGADYISAVQTGLQIQYEKTVHELKVMCDRGVSDNFYVFTNFINFIKANSEFIDRPESLKAILKMPVFSNHYLIGFLNQNSGLVQDSYMQVYADIGYGVFEMVKMSWVHHMVMSLGQKRKKLNGYFTFNN
jgi:hypothetical protein